jgi:UDPglucose 6-dehydrogenase
LSNGLTRGLVDAGDTMNICIMGTGYVGLVTGVCFAEFGLSVTCVDKDEPKIRLLQSGSIPIYEPGLEEMLRKNMKEGRIRFTTDLGQAVRQSLVIFIAVGTPCGDSGMADLQYVKEVALGIARNLNGYKVVVTKSTVPVGTGKLIEGIIRDNCIEKVPFDVVSNPEFLREGSAIEDFMRPNRVVIGTQSQQAVAILRDLYSPLYLIETPFVITSVESAEIIKYASNAFLATKISFINEVANLCERVGADVQVVARAMGLDGRIGSKFLHAGPGFGGSCFPKDTQALASLAQEKGCEFRIVQAAMEVNRRQPLLQVEKIKGALGGLGSKKIGVLGLAFKPNTDDVRESPAICIVQQLQEEGADIQAFDPAAMENARGVLQGVQYAADAYEAAADCDAVIIVTEWNQFRNLDLQRLKGLMRGQVFIDLRNIYAPEKLKAMGFHYLSVGR